MNVLDFNKAREVKNPKITGVAVCGACSKEWAASAPAGQVFLQCPACSTHRGRFVHPALLQEGVARLACSCGCQMFQLTDATRHCINCGLATNLAE